MQSIVDTPQAILCAQCGHSPKGFVAWQETIAVYDMKTLCYIDKKLKLSRCISCGKLHVKNDKQFNKNGTNI